MIEPPCIVTLCRRAVSRMNSYASPPGSLDPFAGSTSALALRTVRSPPRLSQTSGNETISGLSSATAASIRRVACAILSALFAPGFIWTTVTRIRALPGNGFVAGEKRIARALARRGRAGRLLEWFPGGQPRRPAGGGGGLGREICGGGACAWICGGGGACARIGGGAIGLICGGGA